MRLTLHLTREQRIRLEQAAALGDQTLNDFIIDSACAAAERVLRNAPPRILPEQYSLRLDTPETASAKRTDKSSEARPARSLWDEP